MSAIPLEGEFRRGAWRDGLAELTGMSARAISRALAELAAAGYEMRQPVTDRDGKPVTDKRGRTVYATKGHALRFVVPRLSPRPAPSQESSHPSASNQAHRSPDLATYDGQSSPDLATKDPVRSPNLATYEAQRSPDSATPSPQPPLLAAVADVEAGRAEAGDEMAVDGGGGEGGRCQYAGCQWPDKPTDPGSDYHADPCEGLAALRSRISARTDDGSSAA